MRVSVTPQAAIGPAIALLANVILLATILAGGTRDEAPANEIAWDAGLSGSIGGVFSRKPIDTYKQILARPIFFKSREPFAPAPPLAPPVSRAAPAVVDPNLVLGGVMIQNDVRKAYVFSRANTSGSWIGEGEEFLGWQIRSVDGTGARLEQKGHHIDLSLYPKD